MVGMDRISHEAADWLRRQVAPMLRSIGMVRTQLERRGYTPGHPLLRAVKVAHDQLHWLHITAHYESLKGGVGEPYDPSRDEDASKAPPTQDPPAT